MPIGRGTTSRLRTHSNRYDPGGNHFLDPGRHRLFFNIDASGGYVGGFLDGLGTAYGNSAAPVTVAFAAPQAAFGFDTTDLMGKFTVDLFDGSSSLGSFSYGSAGFYGFASNAFDITSVQVEGSSSVFNFDFDNFTFNGSLTSSPVPEPGSWLLALLGFGLAGTSLRRSMNRRDRLSIA